MFRVSYSDTAEGQCWSLFGRLAGPWAEEMRSCWKSARHLKEVNFVDRSGEGLPAEMRSAGAESIATGSAHQHLLETLFMRGAAQEGENK